TRIIAIVHLKLGDHALIQGEIVSQQLHRGRRLSLLCSLQDETGIITLRFFHFNQGMRNAMAVGTKLRCFGEARWQGRGLEMVHPECQQIKETSEPPVSEALTPIYPTTEGLTQRSIRSLIKKALDLLNADPAWLPDYLPDFVRNRLHLPELKLALNYIHHPPMDAVIELLEQRRHPTQRRLAFEELLANYLSLQHIRKGIQQHQSPRLKPAANLFNQMLAILPFRLTQAQQRVVQEIQADIQINRSMLRLVQGDVGSGKTVVAALAMLQAIANGYQAAFMAPTELLAEQHYKNICTWFEQLGLSVAWLSGSTKGKKRAAMLEIIADGRAKIAVGTHALFQEGVEFNKLGLVVIDEQHRFGVHQRLALREKGAKEQVYPHQLIMTATPIPRTLAMTAYADLDHSIIDELPPGRTPVKTAVIPNSRRNEMIEHIRTACRDKRQAYWVCSLIEESEVLECQAAEATAALLQESLAELKIGLVHGRMKAAAKEQVMADFKAGHYDLLVATTVIEVGVDVPNASLMIIENPERFGLAQLHQLRGRVGRGAIESHCVLLYQSPLSAHAKERLKVMRETNDGFIIAEKDLELRGPGEVLGTKQSGLVQMRIADLMRDSGLIPRVQEVAELLTTSHSDIIEPLIKRWLAIKENYSHA
ncbi:MAG: ATP-dependent helicase RecG, partial [Gammaproteobacteria bacterium]|nr:ATP-dependent helicase RecG [Gammaproteobacteria bacterium]